MMAALESVQVGAMLQLLNQILNQSIKKKFPITQNNQQPPLINLLMWIWH
jgi:predicted oxidoreductase (fatty acid repression mutant protein)